MISAVSDSAAELARVTPDQLSEVADRAIILGLAGSVVIEHFLLMPAVDHGTRHLDEVGPLLRGGSCSAEIAAAAVLQVSALVIFDAVVVTYHVLDVVGASAHIFGGHLGERCVPPEILSAMDATPVPMRIEHSINELLIIGSRDLGIFDGVAFDDAWLWRCQYEGCQRGDEDEKLHGG